MPRPRSTRRKQVEVLSERPNFEPGQAVAVVIQSCGENKYEVHLEDGTKALFHLPKRLRHVTFIRRGSYVFVRDDATRRGGKVRGDIEAVVLDQFLSSLRRESFWPKSLNEIGTGRGGNLSESAQVESEVEESEEPDWEIGGANPNRRAWSSESSSDSNDDS